METTKSVHTYKRKTPSVLNGAFSKIDQPCYLYIIDICMVKTSTDPRDNFTGLGFLFANELPSISKFPIYLRQGKAEVSFVKAANKQIIDSTTMELIHGFHTHVFEDILKMPKEKFQFSPEQALFPLLVVPIIKISGAKNSVPDVKLDHSHLLSTKHLIRAKPDDATRHKFKFDEQCYKDAHVYRWYGKEPEFCRVRKILPHQKPSSPFPNKKFTSYNDFFMKSHNLKIFNQQQPLLDVKRVNDHMNLIFPYPDEKKSSGEGPKLIPELVHVHPYSAKHWKFIFALPTVLHRLNQFLLIEELRTTILQDVFKEIIQIKVVKTELLNKTHVVDCKIQFESDGNPNWSLNEKFGCTAPTVSKSYKLHECENTKETRGVPSNILLQALTTKSAHDAFNLERLETIGDSFLKFATTVFLYLEYPKENEGYLTTARSAQISNENLCKLGKLKSLPSLMQTIEFDPKTSWLPPSYVQVVQANKNAHNSITEQSFADKTIADVVEALIGAHLTTLGSSSVLKFMEWMGLKVPLETKHTSHFMNGFENLSISNQQLPNTFKEKDFNLLEKKIGYKFRNKAFLVEAFTHGSYDNKKQNTKCYQRLEFLGDAVLDYLVARFLFEHKSNFSPGALTDLRAAIVNNAIFASFVVNNKIHKCLLFNSSELAKAIDKFVKICETNLIKSGGCLNFDTFLRIFNNNVSAINEEFHVPGVLSDIFESLAGAIYLDCNMNLEIVWRVYYNLMKDVIGKYCENPPLTPIRELLEFPGINAVFSESKKINDLFQIDITINGRHKFTGKGQNKRLAKNMAAKEALNFLKKHKK